MNISSINTQNNTNFGAKLCRSFTKGKKIDLNKGKTSLLEKCTGYSLQPKTNLKAGAILKPKSKTTVIDFEKGFSKFSAEQIAYQEKIKDNGKDFIDIICDIVGEIIRVD